LCEQHDVDYDALTDLRGYRLPYRRAESPLARERLLLVGDAAGLIDPLSGDGMYEAFVSGRLAAESILGESVAEYPQRVLDERFRGKLVLELGVVPGGYAWVFPKGDHVNVGVGGWESEGPRLREHLAALCERESIDVDSLQSVRGHRLPLRRPGFVVARGKALLVGDAAGLVDPLTGDGMYEAFVSARLASEAALDVLAGRAATVEPYADRLGRALGPLAGASWGAKLALDRFPRTVFTLARLPLVWPVVERLVRGDIKAPDEAQGLSRPPLKAIAALARFARAPAA
jgi:flavin-dependent dehydrogenase